MGIWVEVAEDPGRDNPSMAVVGPWGVVVEVAVGSVVVLAAVDSVVVVVADEASFH